MANLTINQFNSGSISDSNLGVIGDPNTGALTQTGFKAMKDYFTAGITGSGGNVNTGSLATTASLNAFTASYYQDSSSFNTRISNITGSNINTGSLLQTSSFNAFTSSYYVDSSSFNTRINSVTGSGGNVNTGSLLLTSSFNTYTASIAPFPTTFTASVPFNRNYTAMSYSLSGSNILLVPNTGSAQAYGSSVITIIGDGTHSASFGGLFNKLSNSSTFGTGSGVANLIYCFFDGNYFFYEMANVGAVATGSNDVIANLANLIRYYDAQASTFTYSASNYITTMTDLSPVQSTAFQFTSGSQPTLNVSGGIDCFGVSQQPSSSFLWVNSAALTLANGATIITVMENDLRSSGQSDQGTVIQAGGSLSIRSGSIYHTLFGDTGGSQTLSGGYSGTTGQKGVWIFTYDSGRNMNVYFNGSNVLNKVMSGSGAGDTLATWGGFTGFQEHPIGSLYHLSAVQRTITGTEITNVTNFLRTRFNF